MRLLPSRFQNSLQSHSSRSDSCASYVRSGEEIRLKRANPLFILFNTETEMKTKILILSIILVICTTSAASETAHAPFPISGYVINEDGSACNNPDVTITNLNTGKTFLTLTLPSSNYYRADPTPRSSDEVSENDLLRFTVGTDAGSAALDHSVTTSDMAFGLFLNLTISVDECRVFAVTGSGAGGASMVVPTTGSPELAMTPPAQEAELQESSAQTPRSPQESEPASHKPGPTSPEGGSNAPGFGAMFGVAVMGLAAALCLMLRRRTR